MCRIQLQKKKSGVKMSENFAIKWGVGGVGRLMANAILNFHFDYWHTSLRWELWHCHSPTTKMKIYEWGAGAK